METKKSFRYSDLEKQEFIEQWKQSGKSKMTFCKEIGIGYYSLLDWVKRGKKKPEKSKSLFAQLRVKSSNEPIFARIILRDGSSVNIYQQVDPSFVRAILKA